MHLPPELQPFFLGVIYINQSSNQPINQSINYLDFGLSDHASSSGVAAILPRRDVHPFHAFVGPRIQEMTRGHSRRRRRRRQRSGG